MKNTDLGLLKGLGNLRGTLGIAQSRACRAAVAEIESLTAENEKLRAKMHKTRDGEPVVEGDIVFTVEQDGAICKIPLRRHGTKGPAMLEAHGGHRNAKGVWCDWWHKPDKCYSSREAAEENM